MKPIHRQRLLLGGFALASAIYLVDLFTGSAGPEPASAATPRGAQDGLSAEGVSSDGTNAGGVTKRAAGRASSVDVETLLARLQTPLADSCESVSVAQIRDPFVREIAAVASQPAESEARRPDGIASEAEIAEQFAAKHRLDGVVVGRVPLAIIDGRALGIGAEIDGFLIDEIERERVVLRRGPETVLLRLSGRRPADSRNATRPAQSDNDAVDVSPSDDSPIK